MSVSVIVSNFNGMRFLPRLLETIRGQRGVTVQIVVVDRLSGDGSLEYLKSQPDVLVIQEPPETGLVSGYAAGTSGAVHKHLFFCNEDMWFAPDCLQRLEEKIDPAAGVFAADPWQWTYDGEHLIHAGTRFRRVAWTFLCPYPFRQQLFTEEVGSGDLVPFPCAGAFMMHRDAYDAVGGWDRSFFLDYEDIDLFIRVWQLGWRCVSVPEAKVYHAVGASNVQQIVKINTPVKRRRYISGVSSIAVIGLKYFTSAALLYPLLLLLLTVFKDAMRLRPQRTWLALLAAKEFLRRSGEAFRFRSRWAANNRQHPGQMFFRSPLFEANIRDGCGQNLPDRVEL